LAGVARLGHSRRISVVQIRPAVAGDLPALRRVYRRASLSNEGDREVLLANPDALELPGTGVAEGRTRVAIASDGTIVGFATGLRLDGAVLDLEDLFVDPDWRRRGIARRLVADLVASAAHQGISRIEVTANPHADAFYRSVGFIYFRDEETRFGPAPRLQLDVDTESATRP
jgi:GNAT superfamily N-acetyltransferase